MNNEKNVLQKKQPERKCTGCGAKRPKIELIRVVREPDGQVSLDFKGKKSGRGAYICKNAACLKKAIKSKRIQSNLEVEIPETVTIELEKELTSNEQ